MTKQPHPDVEECLEMFLQQASVAMEEESFRKLKSEAEMFLKSGRAEQIYTRLKQDTKEHTNWVSILPAKVQN